MKLPSRTRLVVTLAVLVVVAAVVALRPFGDASSAGPGGAAVQAVPASPSPAEASPTPAWGGPTEDGAPGPGASPCIEVNPGDCGIVTEYSGAGYPYKPTPHR